MNTGATHVFTRKDRDQYIQIIKDEDYSEERFKKKGIEFDSRGVVFDVKSIMNYGESQTSTSGKKNIIALEPNSGK